MGHRHRVLVVPNFIYLSEFIFKTKKNKKKKGGKDWENKN